MLMRCIRMAVLGSAALYLAGCATLATPGHVGFLFTDADGGLMVGEGRNLKMGEATSEGIIGIVRGDASISAAMKAGNISKIHHVDYHYENILGIVTTYTTKVYGE